MAGAAAVVAGGAEGSDGNAAGTYPFFIRRVVRDMAIQPEDAILDLGSGSERNACLTARYLSDRGRIAGLDAGVEMLEQARRYRTSFSNGKEE